MPDPRWTGPPEIVAAIFEAGSPLSVLANNAVWVTETANKELAAGLSTVNAFATAAQWQGVSGVASMVASTGLNTGLHTLVGWTAHKIGVTTAAVEAFSLARSSVIPSIVSTTNRFESGVLISTNFIGQNTPAIIERDHEYYLEHWPQNSTIGWGYASTLAALVAALAVPPPLAPMGASPAAPAAAAEAVGEAAAQGGMNGAMQVGSQATQGAGQAAAAPAEGGSQMSSMMQMPMQMMQSVMEPMQQLVQAPMQAFQSIGQLPQSLMQSMTGMMSGAGGGGAGALGAGAEPVLAGATAGGLGSGSAGGLGGGVGGLGSSGAALTSYTRPTSSFEPETAGRPTGLRAGMLNAAEVRGPTATGGMGGSPMPMSPAGMLGHGKEGAADKDIARARVVVGADRTDSE